MSQGFVLVCGLATTAVLGRSLTEEQFGLWAVILSLAALGAHFDLGLGQALRNRLAKLAASSVDLDAKSTPQSAFSGSFLFLTRIAALGIVAVIAVIPALPWGTWLRIDNPELAHTVPFLIASVFVLLFVNLPLNLGGWGFFAYQESHWRGLLDGARALLLFVSALTVMFLPFDYVVLVYYLSFTASTGLGVILFLWRRSWSLRRVCWQEQIDIVRPMARSSFFFWLLGISSTLLVSTSALVASRTVGLAQAGDFRVIQQMFSLLTVLSFTMLTPLWSAYTQAATLGEWGWIRNALRRSLALTVALFVCGGVVLLAIYKPLTQLWIGREAGSFSLILVFSLMALVMGIINCLSVLLNGLNHVKVQAIVACCVATLNLPLGLYWGSRLGLPGIVIGSTLALLPLLVINSIQVHHLLRNARLASGTPQ